MSKLRVLFRVARRPAHSRRFFSWCVFAPVLGASLCAVFFLDERALVGVPIASGVPVIVSAGPEARAREIISRESPFTVPDGDGLRSFPDGAETEAALTEETLRRAMADPEAALRWASSFPEERRREEALGRVCSVIAERDPALAVDCAERLDPPWSDRGFLPGLLCQWAEKDREAAIAWARSRADSADRDDFLTFIALAWARNDPAAATEWARTALGSGEARDEALLAVLPHWFDRAPADADAWLARATSAEATPPKSDL